MTEVPIFEFQIDTESAAEGSPSKKAEAEVSAPLHLRCILTGSKVDDYGDIQFAHNGNTVVPSETITIQTSSAHATLQISSFGEQHMGTYECHVKAKSSGGIKRAKMRVDPKPDPYTGAEFGEALCSANLSENCLHGGTCFYRQSTGTYSCKCQVGYSGLHCEYYLPNVEVGGVQRADTSMWVGSNMFALGAIFGGLLVALIFGSVFYLMKKRNNNQKRFDREAMEENAMMHGQRPSFSSGGSDHSHRSCQCQTRVVHIASPVNTTENDMLLLSCSPPTSIALTPATLYSYFSPTVPVYVPTTAPLSQSTVNPQTATVAAHLHHSMHPGLDASTTTACHCLHCRRRSTQPQHSNSGALPPTVHRSSSHGYSVQKQSVQTADDRVAMNPSDTSAANMPPTVEKTRKLGTAQPDSRVDELQMSDSDDKGSCMSATMTGGAVFFLDDVEDVEEERDSSATADSTELQTSAVRPTRRRVESVTDMVGNSSHESLCPSSSSLQRTSPGRR